MKVYRGIRDGTRRVRVVEHRAADGTELSYDLPERPELFARPPASFDWGADTPGVLHLAAALLADRGTDPRMMRALAPFFRRLFSRLPPEGFEISDTFLDAVVYAVAASSTRSPSTASASSPPAKDAATASAPPDGDARPRRRELDAAT